MKVNEGRPDRLLRVVIGLAALSLYLFGPHTIWGLLGILPLATGIVGFCPLYRAIGVSTCRTATS